MSGGWEDWEWDETLFAGAAPFYVQGRVPYAPGLADALHAALGLDGTGRLLDVGCGPGVVALRLAPLFDEVVGLDPDAGMLAEAARVADERGVANARWVQRRAEELPADLGRFGVATFAASFHWMDRPLVATTVRTMLDAGGAAVQVDAPGYRPDQHEVALPFPARPFGAIAELRRRYLGPDRRAGRGIRNTSPSGEDEVFQAAGFAPAVEVTMPDGRVLEMTADRVVAGVFSDSSSTTHLLGEQRDAFESDLRDLLRTVSPSGRFSVHLPDNVLRIWRPLPTID